MDPSTPVDYLNAPQYNATRRSRRDKLKPKQRKHQVTYA